MKVSKKKKIITVGFCHSCKTDLRKINRKEHRALGHDVRIYDHDPRDPRYKAKEIIGSTIGW